MWIDLVLLANMAARPSHGYELRRRVEESTGYALSNNSLYPALRRFAEAGAAIKIAEPQEGRPPRHVYTITEVGRELLHDLLADLPDELADDNAEFLVRVSQFQWLTDDERRQVIDARERALAKRHIRLTALRDTTEPDAWSRVVLDELLSRLHAEQNWLTALRDRAIPLSKEDSDDHQPRTRPGTALPPPEHPRPGPALRSPAAGGPDDPRPHPRR
jgi:DNA-binding PadR family transcriptional regulator